MLYYLWLCLQIDLLAACINLFDIFAAAPSIFFGFHGRVCAAGSTFYSVRKCRSMMCQLALLLEYVLYYEHCYEHRSKVLGDYCQV